MYPSIPTSVIPIGNIGLYELGAFKSTVNPVQPGPSHARPLPERRPGSNKGVGGLGWLVLVADSGLQSRNVVQVTIVRVYLCVEMYIYIYLFIYFFIYLFI